MSETNSEMGNGKNFEVGYKKPPVATRWQKGRSGNPSGRKKPQTFNDELDLGRILQEIDNEQIVGQVGRKKVRTTYVQARIEGLFDRAIRGSLKEAREIVVLAGLHFAVDAVGDTEAAFALHPMYRLEDLSREELALLVKLTQSQAAQPDKTKRSRGQSVVPVSEAVVFRSTAKGQISFVVDGVRRKMSRWEALIRQVYIIALDGNAGAARLINRIRKRFPGNLPLGDTTTYLMRTSDLGL